MYGKPQLSQIFKTSYSQRSSTYTQRNCILKNFVNVPTLKVFCQHPNRDRMLKTPCVPKKKVTESELASLLGSACKQSTRFCSEDTLINRPVQDTTLNQSTSKKLIFNLVVPQSTRTTRLQLRTLLRAVIARSNTKDFEEEVD